MRCFYLSCANKRGRFWAYQYYWNRAPWNENKENGRPVFNTYAWASYEFIREDSNYNETRPAAHTYIHETGHMFGLDDYYDYDGKSAPIGGGGYDGQ